MQGNEAVLNMQKSAEVIVGIWAWKHGHSDRRTESVGVLSMTEKGGMTAYIVKSIPHRLSDELRFQNQMVVCASLAYPP